eukprot:gb/GECH01007270.1/.p1 GENE.gb/GECH01007270.1/~~gb/GECH01007270.1/.p1  ORF type:complete len:149 (+),score=33.81 gb/GECH01007270.1/:1-447(+)
MIKSNIQYLPEYRDNEEEQRGNDEDEDGDKRMFLDNIERFMADHKNDKNREAFNALKTFVNEQTEKFGVDRVHTVRWQRIYQFLKIKNRFMIGFDHTYQYGSNEYTCLYSVIVRCLKAEESEWGDKETVKEELDEGLRMVTGIVESCL